MEDTLLKNIFHETLDKLLSLSDQPSQCVACFIRQIHELVGEGSVIIALQNENGSAEILSIYPSNKQEWAKQPAINALIGVSVQNKEIQTWTEKSENKQVAGVLNQLKIEKAISIPLVVDDTNVGSVLLLNIMEMDGTEEMIKLLSKLSGVLALILHNTTLKNRLENQIENRTNELKKRNEELAESETKYRNLVENSPDAIAIYNSNEILLINNECLRLMRATSADQLIGKNVIEFVHPDYRKFVVERMTKALTKGEVLPLAEEKFIRLDGTACDVEVKAIPITYDGKPAVQLIVSDITERKTAEALLKHERELYRDLVNTQPAGIYRIRVFFTEKWSEDAWSNSANSPYVMELASDRFCQILGISREKFKNNPKIIGDLIHPDDRVEFEIKNKEANIKQIPFNIDCRLLIKGKIKWVHLESLPRILENGDIIFTGILYDISERMEAQSSLQNNIDILKKLLEDNNELIEFSSDNIDFSKLTDVIVKVSGAKFGSLNIYEDNHKDFRTVAISGESNIYSKAIKFLGYDVKNKLWSFDPVRDEKIKNNTLTKFQTLTELIGKVIPASVSRLIEKTFHLGEIYILNISRKDLRVGDFTLYFQNGTTIKNIEILELYANQVAMFIARRHAEKKLQVSEENFRAIFESNSAAIAIIEPDSTISMVNNEYCKLSGYTKEEVIGMSWTEQIPPDDLERLKEFARLRSIDPSSVPGRYEFKFYRKDGEIRHALMSVTVIENTYQRICSFNDITERKRNEDLTIRSKDRLNRAEFASKSGNWEMHLDTMIIKASIGANKLYGLYGTDFNYDHVKAVPLPEYRAFMDESLKRLIEKGEPYELDFKIKTADTGEIKDIHSTATFDKEKRILFGVIQDVTEQKKASEQLRESENFFRIVFEQSVLGKIISSTDSKIIKANKAFADMLGYTIDEVEQLRFVDFTHPDDKNVTIEAIHSLMSLENPSLRFEKRYLHKNGKIVWVDIHSILNRNEDGTPNYFISSISDITNRKISEIALKKSEERYSSLLNYLETGIVVHAPDTSIVMNNPRASELLGLSSEQMKGKVAIDPAWCFINTDYSPMSLEDYPVRRVLNTNQPIKNQLLGIQQSTNAKITWVNVNGFPVFNNENEITEIVISFNDITERKLAEEKIIESEKALRRQNQLFDSLIRNLPIGVFMVDAHTGKPLMANENASKLLGRGILPDATKQNLHEVYKAYKADSKESYPVDEMPIIKAMNGESSTVDDMLVIRPDGTETMLEIFGSPVTDENGNIWAGLVSFMDISDRKNSQKKLQDSEETFRLMFENNPQPMFIYDYETLQFIQVNQAAINHYGYSKEEFLSMTIKDIRPQEDIPGLMKKLQMTDMGVNSDDISRHIKKNGELIYVEITSAPVVSNGKKARHVLIQDITQRKTAEDALAASEELYRTLVMRIPDGVYKSTPTGEFIEVNPALVKMLGYDSKEELMSLDIKKQLYFLPEDRDQALLNEVNQPISELKLKKKDGSEIWLEDNCWYNRDENGEVIYNEGVLRDITERKRTEDELKNSFSLLHASIESTADGILVVDTEGKTTLYNQKFAEMWGIPTELLETGFDEQLLRYVVTKLVDPDNFLDKVSELYKNPELLSVDDVKLSDGRTFVRYSIPQRIGENIVGRVWSFRDITDRLKIEKSLLEKMNDMTRLLNLTVDRELVMIELKKEVNQLLVKTGNEGKYKIVE